MIATYVVLGSIVVAAAVVEIAVPGRDAYHSGWFNGALVTLVVATILAARGELARARSTAARAAIAAIVFGAAIAGFAAAASGLLAPDNRTVVGAPGQRVRIDDLGGTLDFPLAGTERRDADPATVVLDRPGRRPLPIGGRGRDAGGFILRPIARSVVSVEARDPRGGRLTVTQPSGSAFLSPVLLMQQTQTISGMNLPFDAFVVPAAHRIVKAVLFTPQEAAMMKGMMGAPGPAVLFAVDDENDRPLPRAIGVAHDGATVGIGGLLLRAAVLDYPSIEIVAAPSLVAVIAAVLLVLGGIIVKGVSRTAALTPTEPSS